MGLMGQMGPASRPEFARPPIPARRAHHDRVGIKKSAMSTEAKRPVGVLEQSMLAVERLRFGRLSDLQAIADHGDLFRGTARHEWHTVNLADFPNLKRGTIPSTPPWPLPRAGSAVLNCCPIVA